MSQYLWGCIILKKLIVGICICKYCDDYLLQYMPIFFLFSSSHWCFQHWDEMVSNWLNFTFTWKIHIHFMLNILANKYCRPRSPLLYEYCTRCISNIMCSSNDLIFSHVFIFLLFHVCMAEIKVCVSLHLLKSTPSLSLQPPIAVCWHEDHSKAFSCRMKVYTKTLFAWVLTLLMKLCQMGWDGS